VRPNPPAHPVAPDAQTRAPGRAAAGLPHSSPFEHWRRLASGQRGVRLYHVTLPASGMVCWETELTLNGRLVHRRFASELHARAWISVATEAKMAVSSVERDELSRPVSASCFAEGG
jgi:hypothetical protein